MKFTKIRVNNKKETTVTVPENEEDNNIKNNQDHRASIKIQAHLSEIGEKLGYKNLDSETR